MSALPPKADMELYIQTQTLAPRSNGAAIKLA